MFASFLRRPALAIVISLLILFMGGLSIKMLPISQFPSVAPPTVRVSVSYPGASAKILIDSTMVILEQAINGVPNMRYMMGDATSAGEGTITIVFEPGTDPKGAVMQVNNRVQAVKNQVPEIVQREGRHRFQATGKVIGQASDRAAEEWWQVRRPLNARCADRLPEPLEGIAVRSCRRAGRRRNDGHRSAPYE